MSEIEERFKLGDKYIRLIREKKIKGMVFIYVPDEKSGNDEFFLYVPGLAKVEVLGAFEIMKRKFDVDDDE